MFTARLNAARGRLPLRVLQGDSAARTADSRFDIVISNPPYAPARGALPSRGPERAWDTGPDGRGMIDRICASAPALLRPDGVLLMVHSVMCGAQETVDRLSEEGTAATVVARSVVPWGPVLRSRRAWLRERGLAAEAEQREELVVVRARTV